MWSKGNNKIDASMINIYKPDKFYYIPEEKIDEPIFKINPSGKLDIVNQCICKIPIYGTFTAIPKNYIDEINTCTDIILKLKTSFQNDKNGMTHTIGEYLIGNVINNLKSCELVTHLLLTGGHTSIDFGDKLIILPAGLIVPKFTDVNVIIKLTEAITIAILNWRKHNNHKFVLDNAVGLTIECSVVLSQELKNLLCSENVGSFTLPKNL